MGSNDFASLPHIGESVLRKEDVRFLTGAGQYTDDIQLNNLVHAFFVRSPHAHAIIKSIDKTAALAARCAGQDSLLTARASAWHNKPYAW